MSVEEEKEVNVTATQETQEVQEIQEALDPGAEAKLDDGVPEIPAHLKDDEGDDDEEEQVGWYVKLLSDPDQPHIVEHPEGKTHKEIFEAYVTSKKKKHAVLEIGMVALDPSDVSVFGWSEKVDLPAMEAFDSIQDRMELLADAMGDLTRQQAALQAAHAALIQGELEEMQAEAEDEEDEDEDEGFEGGPAAPPVQAAPAPAPTPAKKRGGFRPPGA